MGTNYYVLRTLDEIEKEGAKKMIDEDKYDDLKEILQEKCEKIHIGKSSCGWKFLFNWNNCKYYELTKRSINDFLTNKRIVDEYGGDVSLESFWEMVENKNGGIDNAEYYRQYEKGSILFEKEYYNNDLAQYNPRFGEFYADGLRFATVTEFC